MSDIYIGLYRNYCNYWLHSSPEAWGHSFAATPWWSSGKAET